MSKFNDKVVYQIYPKSFLDTTGNGVGDINGIITKLDYISELGVDYIWLSPINKSPQRDNGYDIADYYHVDPMFGTDEEYKQLIAECNKRGMKVILDLVLNHTSSNHEWFKRAKAGEEEFIDYYVWTDEPNELMGFFSKSAWSFCPEVGKYYLHLFDQEQPDLNWQNPKVRDEMIKMVNYWIDLGVEGFRLDVIDLIGKEPEKMITAKGPKFYDYLKQLSNNTFKKDLLTVGECWGATLEDSYAMCSEDGLSEVFHFNHLTTTNGKDKWDQSPIDFNNIITEIKKWQNEYDADQTIVMNNHDMPRLVSLWLDDSEQYRYYGATALATFFTLLNGTQYIYQGEEIGMTNAYFPTIEEYNDVESLNKYEELLAEGLTNEQAMKKIKLISRDNARTPIPWTSEGGFTCGTPWLAYNSNLKSVNVEADLNSDNSVYNFYKKLISFKKENYDNIINKQLTDIKYDNGVLSYKKANIEVVCNMSSELISFNCVGQVLFNNYGQFTGVLQPYQALVISNEL